MKMDADLAILLERAQKILQDLPNSPSQGFKLSAPTEDKKEVGCWDYLDADSNYLWSILRFETSG